MPSGNRPQRSYNLFTNPYAPGDISEQYSKRSLATELRRISEAFGMVQGSLRSFFSKTDGNQQIITNDVIFQNDISIEPDSVGVKPVLDLEDSKNVFVPRLLTAPTPEDLNAATKGYVDVIINAAKNSTDYAAFKAAIIAAFP